MAILLQLGIPDEAPWRQAFAERLPDHELRVWPDVGRAEDIEYAAVFRTPDGALARLPRLKAVFSLLAGQDGLLSDPQLPDVPLLRTDTEAGSDAVTETVLMHVLRHYRRLPEYALQQARGEWRRLPQKPREETLVGFLGVGLLGLAAARVVAGHGFAVAGWSRTPREIAGLRPFHGPDGLPALLAQSDIVVNLLPLTPETHGLLDRPVLAHLRRGAALVNVGRGETLVPEALYWALDEGLLSSATLDVFDPEPPPPEARVWRDPRITLTPHAARSSFQVREAVEQVALGIEALRAGRAPAHPVDRARGY